MSAPASKRAAIDALPDHYLTCRDLQHSWTPHDVELVRLGFRRVLRCRDCRVKRVQVITSTGRILRSSYDYTDAEGYSLKGFGRLTRKDRAQIRITTVQRLVDSKEGRAR